MFNIALYQPDIPQNTAAIIRLCSCFDTTLEIIEPCGFHLDDKRLKKIAMDYLDKSKIKYVSVNKEEIRRATIEFSTMDNVLKMLPLIEGDVNFGLSPKGVKDLKNLKLVLFDLLN